MAEREKRKRRRQRSWSIWLVGPIDASLKEQKLACVKGTTRKEDQNEREGREQTLCVKSDNEGKSKRKQVSGTDNATAYIRRQREIKKAKLHRSTLNMFSLRLHLPAHMTTSATLNLDLHHIHDPLVVLVLVRPQHLVPLRPPAPAPSRARRLRQSPQGERHHRRRRRR